MFENKYNSETNTKETEYVPEPEVRGKNRNGALKKITKTIAAICCVAAVSAGSIAGYRYYSSSEKNNADENNKDIIPSTSNTTETTSSTGELLTLSNLLSYENWRKR